MWKQSLILFCTVLVVQITEAQNWQPKRYKDKVFKDAVVTQDQSYYPGAGKDERKAYLFDLYQPQGDANKARPLIIWMHGGGFKFGTKRAKAVRFFSDNFAKRGYVCASINYRLSKEQPLLHFDALLRASYYATQDAKRAVAYFRANAAKYGIDPDKIILAGNSAGGFMALDAAYAKNDDFGRMANIPDAEIKKSGLPNEPVLAAVNYWGGIYNLEWLKNAHTPIISVHGSEDGLVPITHKDAPLHGSMDIQRRADELHISNTLKIFEGYSHELQKHFNPFFEGSAAKGRWAEAAQFTADYLYGLMGTHHSPTKGEGAN